MTKMKLIESLEDFPNDATVYMYTDHGQQAEEITSVSFYCLDDKDIRDPEEVEGEGLPEVVVLQ